MSSVLYKIYSGERTKIGADLALKNRLYVSGWELSRTLQDFRNGHERGIVILAFKADKPIAVLTGEELGFVMLFVRKAERRQGIGTQLFTLAANHFNTSINHDWGIHGSIDFFNVTKEKIFGKDWESKLKPISEIEF